MKLGARGTDGGAVTASRTDQTRVRARVGAAQGQAQAGQGRRGGVRSERKVVGSGMRWHGELRRRGELWRGGLGAGAAALARARGLGHGGIQGKGYGGSVK